VSASPRATHACAAIAGDPPASRFTPMHTAAGIPERRSTTHSATLSYRQLVRQRPPGSHDSTRSARRAAPSADAGSARATAGASAGSVSSPANRSGRIQAGVSNAARAPCQTSRVVMPTNLHAPPGRMATVRTPNARLTPPPPGRNVRTPHATPAPPLLPPPRMLPTVRRLTFAALALAAAGCGAARDATPLAPAPVARVVLTTPSPSLHVGDTVQLTASLFDAAGNALTGRALTWSSTNAAVAAVSAGGLVTAVAAGATTISATSEGRTGSTAITVIPTGVARVTVTPTAQALTPGDTLRLSALVTDANGAPITGFPVTWTTSDSTRATVSADGVVTVVASAPRPQIATIAPALLTVGATATIAGSNFAAAANGVQVTVSGTPVLVTAAGATQLTVTIPATLPCTPTGPVPVVVTNTLGTVTITATSDGKSGSTALTLGSVPDSAQHALQIAVQRTIAAGQVLMITDPSQVGCNELLGSGGRYLVDVYNDFPVADGITGFEVRGAGGVTGAAAAAASRARPAPRTLTAPRPAARGPLRAAWMHLVDGHAEREARQIAAVRPLIAAMKARGARRPALNAAGGGARATVPLIPQTVGDTVTLKYGTGSGCQTFVNVTARVVYVGAHGIVLEATDSPLAGQMDSEYVALGKTFDSVMYPILTTYFGDPMAFDDSLAGNGKVTMLFTRKVSDESPGLLGFVTACDMFPPSYDAQVPSSNNTELFYARVPLTAAGSAADITTIAGWKSIIPSTLIHETKHITAIAERFADPVGTDLEESWFEEGTAQVAAELYARTLYAPAAGWKSDAGYQGTVSCDVRGATVGSPCFGSEYLMADQFSFLYDYMAQNEATSFLSSGSADADIYGSAWLFARWLLDQYSTQESDLLKPLVRDATMQGVQNITDKTGRSWDELDGYFTMALAADDYPGFAAPPGARYVVPSWNLRDIDAGLNADFPTDFSAWPLGVHAEAFGRWVQQVPLLAGGSGAFFDLSGSQTAPQLLDVHAPSGEPLAAGHPLRLVILRIQ